MKIHVLRLSHRPFRDQRISTHCGLVARIFDAEKMIYTGKKDEKLEESIKKIVEKWGGNFKIEYRKQWKDVINYYKSKNFLVVHLTVYGMPAKNMMKKITSLNKNLLVVVGGEKVPPEIYKLSDFNVSITNQPHSEISALALFLYMYFGKIPKISLRNAKLKIIPQERGKKIIKTL